MSARRRCLAALLALLLGGCSLPGAAPSPTPAPTATATAPAPPTTVPSPGATATGVPAPSNGGTLTVGLSSSVTATATVSLPTVTVPRPTPTVSPPTATATPAAPRLTKLTGDGCCARPAWADDGRSVRFYGYGGPGGRQIGSWAIPRGGGAIRALGTAFGAYSPSGRLLATRAGTTTTVFRADGTPLGTLDSGAALVFLAPTDDRIAWMVPDASIPQVSTSLEPPARVRVAEIGPGGLGAARTLDPIVRAEVLHWLPDGRQIVLSTRDAQGRNGGVAILDTVGGGLRQIAAGNFLESVAVSPDGAAVVYTAVLQPTAAENGVWYVRTDGTGRRKLPIAGGYRWSPDGRGLVTIPAPSSQPTDELLYFSLADGTIRTLVGVQAARFIVANDDWELAPDGRAIVFRSANDGAIWVLEF